ncbi:chromosome segregation protein sudA [Coniosporium apollinis CBS 100218]|uniref:Structural maintenance of chromosomes protein n=1 Tax=Coniosporium apollinis (strain CBS 100218) TaxID=1168221 RepID=R7YV34_CONA1|nr:chromosome segregation protein sudA [Coniosporium apollinis CBS 100218]EON65649.1 chromosome segregation protein sudA [Coniosporium apollinis CBS 100218]
MYIKQIIIQGFKSYKDQTVIEPFSPKLNVIVGRNGSGKSNFFAAIRFVLSDAYTQLGREERQALLHEGSGSAVMSAYVEIIFDNSDERFPTGKSELVLRRTIGLKKDEYSLDRKNATKADVMNLLESAGFSRSNPYYIVPQGRVTALTNMKDPERLNLLKEVAGTQVYESRRQDSLKIMSETDNKRAKIDDLLTYIRERLDELEEEKEELKAYQEKDRERRCLEYTIYHREQIEIQRALESIDELRQTGVDETDDNRERYSAGEQELAQIDAEISDVKQRIEFLRVDKAQLEDERREVARDKAKIELEVNGLTEGQSAARQARTQHEDDLREVQEQIRQREQELAQIMPEYNNRKEQEAAIKAQLIEAEGTRQRLYAKQGRTAQFRNKRDRDAWLQGEIDAVNVALATRKAVAMQTTEEITDLETEIGRLEEEITGLRARIDNRGDNMQTISENIQRAKEERDRLMDQRKELWREEAKLDSVVSNAQRELEKAEKFLSHMMDQNTSRGIAAVRRIKRQHNLEGVYGTLAELFEVPDRYKTAVEVTAGTSLFHYVVDSDETATKVLEILQREKAGRVTFMPLNRLRPKPVNIPKASDALHMITKLTYDPTYEKAYQHVFGKTIICPNLQVAAQYARSHAVSAITPEGDRADRKGALTGGFHDPRQSRIDAIKNVTKWRTEYENQKNRVEEVRRALEQKDQEITRAVGELQKLEQQRQQLENSYGPLRQELRSKSADLQNKRDSLDAKHRTRENIEAAVRELGEQQSAYEAEMAAPFAKALSRDEEQQLETLSAAVQDLRRQYSELRPGLSELESRKTVIEVELRENLRPRLEQLQAQEADNGGTGAGGDGNGRLKERQRELKRINKAFEAVEGKLREAEEAIEQANNQLAELEGNKAEKQRQQEEIAHAISRHQKRMEKSMAKKALLTEKLAECSRNIRDLGVLPEEAFDKYQRMESDKAIKRLHKVNDALKKYSHVNKKAFEQYAKFQQQRDTLTKRRSELDSSQKSIEELIEVLDQRKDEAIERTFKQVSREFANVFEKLVPAGKGRLIIQRKSDRQARQEQEEESGQEERESVENYTGVGISVSFNSKHDEQQRIQQLSGGQKSLCALALVFAIQQCDPAPFYLFDEIDANLDAQYRTAVASMLQTLSETTDGGGQFICTTFRPEMVMVAEKCYGVSYSNKTSSIDVVNREDALNFVEGQRL